MTISRKQAEKMLDRLIELDAQTMEAYYDMGSLISSMQHGQMHKILEYSSMTQLIEEELTYTPSTAFKYASMYRHFRRLHYLKHEAVSLLKEFGLTHMCDILPAMKDKLGVRAIRQRVAAIDEYQINFTLNSAELDACHRALTRMGAVQSDGGRYENSSAAFMAMVNQVNLVANKKLKVVK